MTPKEKYRQLCKEEKTIPIFSKDWWMDAVCGEDNWDVLLVEKGEDIVASMPIYIKKKFGLKYVTQPKLTQTNGIWIKYPEGQKYSSRLSYEKEIMNEIIDQLEELDITYYQQNFHYSITNWLPFYWRGFKQTTRYTYVIEDLSDLDKVYSEFTSSTRNKIRKAEKIVSIYTTGTLKDFYEINKMTFNRQNIDIPYTFQFLKKQDELAQKNNCRRIFFAYDENGKLHSALYLVWDELSSYVHLVGENPELRSSGAGILLVWEAIRFTRNELGLNIFDFEGSMIETIESVRRGFGAIQKPYLAISKAFKYKPLFNLYKIIRNI